MTGLTHLTLGALAVAALSTGLIAAADGAPVVTVDPGDDIAAVAADHPGAVLELAPGEHASFTLQHPATVRGGDLVVVRGPVNVRSDDVTLERLFVRGGFNGVSVRDVDDALLSGVTVMGAELHGIEVVDSSAVVERCHVTGLTHPYSQGVEVRNTTGRVPVEVRDCQVSGAREGIVTHSAHVVVTGNVVTGTTNRAVAVTEMSEGLVAGNRVGQVRGAAFMCEDMSRCDFIGNEVASVTPTATGVKSRAGVAFAALFHSMAHWSGNEVRDAAGPVALVGSKLMDDSTLSVLPLRTQHRGLLAR